VIANGTVPTSRSTSCATTKLAAPLIARHRGCLISLPSSRAPPHASRSNRLPSNLPRSRHEAGCSLRAAFPRCSHATLAVAPKNRFVAGRPAFSRTLSFYRRPPKVVGTHLQVVPIAVKKRSCSARARRQTPPASCHDDGRSHGGWGPSGRTASRPPPPYRFYSVQAARNQGAARLFGAHDNDRFYDSFLPLPDRVRRASERTCSRIRSKKSPSRGWSFLGHRRSERGEDRALGQRSLVAKESNLALPAEGGGHPHRGPRTVRRIGRSRPARAVKVVAEEVFGRGPCCTNGYFPVGGREKKNHVQRRSQPATYENTLVALRQRFHPESLAVCRPRPSKGLGGGGAPSSKRFPRPFPASTGPCPLRGCQETRASAGRVSPVLPWRR